MIKSITLAAALTLGATAAFAQTAPLARDPAGGTTGGAPLVTAPLGGSPPLTRDPAGGTMVDTNGFRAYVVQQRVQSYRYAEPVGVGVVLPSDGVVYREVPREYGATPYRYTVVNERTVIVDPQTRRIVQIID